MTDDFTRYFGHQGDAEVSVRAKPSDYPGFAAITMRMASKGVLDNLCN